MKIESRRAWKIGAATLVAALAATSLAGCAKESTATTGDQTITIYSGRSEDLIAPLLEQFTAETGIKVSLDTYGSNEEMLAKLQAGAKGYDIVFPSVHMHDTMAALGLLEKTDINLSPGFAAIDPANLRSKEDPTSAYCLPYAWGTVGIFYNETVTGPITGYADMLARAVADGIVDPGEEGADCARRVRDFVL